MAKLTKFHINNIKKMCKKVGCPIDLIDIEALWDSSLSVDENYNRIREELKKLGYVKEEEYYQEDEKEYYESIALEEEKRYIKEQIKKEFEEIMKNETSNLKIYYYELERYIETVLKAKYIHSLFITGKAGIGKSFTVMKVLSRLDLDYKVILGNISPLELYHTLYEYRKGVLVFDDTQGLLNNKPSMSLLMSAMWSPTNKRIVSWLTTKKLKAPPQFEFQGKIIFIANEIPEHIEPIVSRCLEYELKFSYNDLLKIMLEIAKQPHPNLSREERIKIWEWIRDNTDETVENFDLRLQKKIETLYQYNRENWKELAKRLIKRNKLLEIVKELMESNKMVKVQVKEWEERTGLSRRYYFKLKKKLNTLLLREY